MRMRRQNTDKMCILAKEEEESEIMALYSNVTEI